MGVVGRASTVFAFSDKPTCIFLPSGWLMHALSQFIHVQFIHVHVHKQLTHRATFQSPHFLRASEAPIL